jgi:hypothetical protein
LPPPSALLCASLAPLSSLRSEFAVYSRHSSTSAITLLHENQALCNTSEEK